MSAALSPTTSPRRRMDGTGCSIRSGRSRRRSSWGLSGRRACCACRRRFHEQLRRRLPPRHQGLLRNATDVDSVGVDQGSCVDGGEADGSAEFYRGADAGGGAGQLDRLSELVKRRRFERLVGHLRDEASPGWPALVLPKAVLLQSLYGGPSSGGPLRTHWGSAQPAHVVEQQSPTPARDD